MAVGFSRSDAMMARSITCAVLYVLTVFCAGRLTTQAIAQGKDNKGNPLDKQLRAAQNDLLGAQRQIAALRQENASLSAANNKLQAAAKKDAKVDEKTVKGLRTTLDGYRGAGLVHVVVLKAKDSTAPSDIKDLIDESYSQLAKIKTVRGLWAGKPAAKSVEGAATDYAVALVMVFDDAAGLKTYFDDPVHVRFMDRHLKKWETPLVYDFEPQKPKQ
jgi:Stress responsive A/B Barrel Domain